MQKPLLTVVSAILTIVGILACIYLYAKEPKLEVLLVGITFIMALLAILLTQPRSAINKLLSWLALFAAMGIILMTGVHIYTDSHNKEPEFSAGNAEQGGGNGIVTTPEDKPAENDQRGEVSSGPKITLSGNTSGSSGRSGRGAEVKPQPVQLPADPKPVELTPDGAYQEGKKALQRNNISKAMEFYRSAADRGNLHAAGDLARIYLHGEGVKRDYSLGREYAKIAADGGMADGYFYMGEIYHGGWGVEADHKTADEWYRKAIDKGHQKAKNERRKLIVNN